MSWHHHACNNANFRWDGGVPSCDICGCSASSVIADASEIPPPPPPPKAPKRSQLKLSWPPCVKYSGPIVNEKENSVTAFLIENIDRWANALARPLGIESDGEQATELTSEVPCGGSGTSESSVGAGIDDALSRNHHSANTSQIGRKKGDSETVYGHLPKLDGFRLLRLHGAGSFHAPVHCSLEIAQLHDAALSTYEALSYTWADLDGDKRNCRPVFIGLRYQVLLVTRNCQSALRSFRTRHDRIIWVDAICINQHDPLERQFQVGLMPEIYTSAARVLIYLGEERNSSQKAMKAVAAHSVRDEDGREAFGQVIKRPYFQRIWVVQEIAHAQKASVTCGNDTVHWTSLCSAARSCKVDLNWINHFALPDRKSRKPPGLLQLLIDTRDSDCADPRDRVYGLIGLVHPDEAKFFPADYSLTVQQVYTGLAAYWAQQPRNSSFLDFFCFTQAEKKILGLPSWVPDWSNLAHRQNGTVGLRVSRDVARVKIPQSSWGFDATEIFSPSSYRNAAHSGYNTKHDRFYVRRQTDIQAGSAEICETNGPIIQSDVGSLLIDGYPLFRCSQGVLTIAGGHKAGLPIKHLKLDGHSRVLNREQELDIFYFPRWSKALLIKRHTESIFSMVGSFFIDLFSSDGGRLTDPSFSKLDEACDHIGQQEANLVLSWFVAIDFLRECFFYRSESPVICTELSDRIESAVKRRALANANESLIRNDHLEAMKQMQTEMVQSLTPEDVDIFLQPVESELWGSQVPLQLNVRKQVEEKFFKALPKWTRLKSNQEICS